MSRIPGPGTSRIPNPGISRIPNPGTSRIPNPGNSRSRGVSYESQIPGASSSDTQAASTSRLRQPAKVRLKFESKLKKFDRSVNEELKRRKDVSNVLVTAATSDPYLREAVDHLARAEAAEVWAGAVHAAEQAAANTVDARRAEEAAAEGARNFQTEIIETVKESIPGLKPIQVLGYVGITRPKRAAR